MVGCRTTVIDVLRGCEFATATRGLVRILLEGGCVSVLILYRTASSFARPLPLGEGDDASMVDRAEQRG